MPSWDQQRMVHVLVIETVVLDQLLLSVGRIVGAVSFDDDDSWAVMAADEAVGQQLIEGADFAGGHGVLQARQA